MSGETRPDAIPFVEAGDDAGAATVFSCPLCRAAFRHGTLACGGCPMNAGCDILKCPQCGYQFPRSSRIVEFAKRLFGTARRGGSS